MHNRKKGSDNRNKQRIRLAKLHRKIKNIRKDFLHKETYRIITKCDGVITENLNISGMMKNYRLSKAIADCGWYEYKRQLKYKALWNNKIFLEVGRFEPTSKMCSGCGWKNDNLTLKDRIFKCEECKLEINRDVNAAINIRNGGLRLLWGTQEASARKRTLVETRGCRTSVRCLSEKQEQKKVSPVSIDY